MAILEVNQHRGVEPAGCGHYLTAQQLALAQAGEIDRYPAAWRRDLDLLFVGLQSADAGCEAAGLYLYRLPQPDYPIGQGSGHHRAKTAQGKDTVNG